MRTAFLLLALFCTLPGAAAAQGLGPPRADRVADTLLVRILNDGAELDIDGLSEDEVPPILPRLYAVAVEGDCVPETHLICGFRYYLALSGDGEAPEQAVFSLGVMGDLTFARFLPAAGDEPPRLRLTIENYPSYVFERNPRLTPRQAVYLVTLDLREIRIAPEP